MRRDLVILLVLTACLAIYLNPRADLMRRWRPTANSGYYRIDLPGSERLQVARLKHGGGVHNRRWEIQIDPQPGLWVRPIANTRSFLSYQGISDASWGPIEVVPRSRFQPRATSPGVLEDRWNGVITRAKDNFKQRLLARVSVAVVRPGRYCLTAP